MFHYRYSCILYYSHRTTTIFKTLFLSLLLLSMEWTGLQSGNQTQFGQHRWWKSLWLHQGLFIYEPHLDYLVQRSHLPAVDCFLPQNMWWESLVYHLICDLMAGTNETEEDIMGCENASVPFQSWQLLFSAAAGEKDLALANVRDLCPINGIQMPHLLHNHIQTETDHNLERKCAYKPLSNIATSAIRGQSKTTVVATGLP